MLSRDILFKHGAPPVLMRRADKLQDSIAALQ